MEPSPQYVAFVSHIPQRPRSNYKPSTKDEKLYELAKAFICSPEGGNLEESFFNEFFSEWHVFSNSDTPSPEEGIIYGPPVGWIRFKLKVDPQKSQMVQDGNWHYCYHGTHPTNLKSIVSNGFLIPGEVTSGGTKIRIKEGHIPNQKFIFTSPSYIYSSHFIYASEIPFTYQNKKYYGRLMFQVRQKPGTFQIQPITLSSELWDNTIKMDPKFENEEIEWKSVDKDSIFPYAVLIKINTITAEKWFTKHMKKQSEESAMIDLGASGILESFRENSLRPKIEKKQILWVDDHPKNNQKLIDYAKTMDVPVIINTSTIEGLQTLENMSERILMIVTDMVRIEGENQNYNAGIELITQVHSKYPNIPIYLYSEYARQHPDVLLNAKSVGCTKSVIYNELERIIHSLDKETTPS